MPRLYPQPSRAGPSGPVAGRRGRIGTGTRPRARQVRGASGGCGRSGRSRSSPPPHGPGDDGPPRHRPGRPPLRPRSQARRPAASPTARTPPPSPTPTSAQALRALITYYGRATAGRSTPTGEVGDVGDVQVGTLGAELGDDVRGVPRQQQPAVAERAGDVPAHQQGVDVAELPDGWAEVLAAGGQPAGEFLADPGIGPQWAGVSPWDRGREGPGGQRRRSAGTSNGGRFRRCSA